MGAANYPACLKIILASEGGYVNNPRDPGGPTNLGITIATLSRWLGRPASIEEVQDLSAKDAAPIYEQDYWAVSHCPQLPDGLDLMTFDTAVNSGPGRAIKLLQAAVGVVADGLFGPHTLAAVGQTDTTTLINAYHAAHEAFYRALSGFPDFGKGWLTRNDRTRDEALAMVTA